MEYLLGERIRDLRGQLKMSQRELCRDICTQGLISRIEKNEVTPTAPVLHQLSIRLGVDLNYFFDDISKDGLDYVKEVMRSIDVHIKATEYKEVKEIVKFEQNNPLFRKRHLQQYLTWREGICVYHLENDYERALNLLDNALDMGVKEGIYSEIEIDILASKAIIFSLSDKRELAEKIYFRLIKDIHTLRVVTNKRLLIRIFYNAGVNSYYMDEFNKSLDYIDKAYNICIAEDEMYLLGHILLQKGCSLFKQDPSKKEKCIKLLEEALWIYELKPVPDFIENLKNEMMIMNKS